MNVMQSDFHALLTSFAAVNAVVETRVFPLVIPQETWDSVSQKPCIVYSISGEDRQPLFCATDDLRQTFMSVDCMARRYLDMARLAEAVKRSLIDFRGRVGGTHFNKIQWVSGIELTDVEPGLYRTAMTFVVWNRSV